MTQDVLLLDSDVEADLRETMRAMLSARCRPQQVAMLFEGDRSIVSPVWRSMAGELGLAGLLVPEDRGGSGGSAREAAVVMEEIGRAVAPVPFLESSVIATTILLAGDSNLVDRLASGDLTAALLVPYGGSSPSDLPKVTVDAAGGLRGMVRDAAGVLDADVLLVAVETSGGIEVRSVASVDVHIAAVTSLDMTRQLADVELDGAPSVVVVPSHAGRDALISSFTLGAAMLASEQAGIAAWCLETTVEYLKTRRQFGRVVGGFQAVKHRLADLYVEVESANASARFAAGAWAAHTADAPIAAAVAASYCGDVAVGAAEEAVQLHGGMGMTWEHPTHLYLKRAKADQIGLGRSDWHREQLAGLINLTLSEA